MKLLDEKMKHEMEECKRRARAAGLQFADDTLEYIVFNRDMLELEPKNMIPTLYDYWVQDVEVMRNKWIYSVHPHNPYETVINTRPPISFYNQDNADWFNVMIFYHVLGHIDFDQNNIFFRNTWDDDFCGQALADKRLITRLRAERGAEKKWVDYTIEFALAIDNLVGYHEELTKTECKEMPEMFGITSEKIDFYFGRFLKRLHEEKRIDMQFYYDEIERYNRSIKQSAKEGAEAVFFNDAVFRSKFPEFNDVFKKWKEDKDKLKKPNDLFEHLMESSDLLNKEDNKWMKDVISVVRRTSLYFQPQIRTKIANEGWASFWHERLFEPDERNAEIKAHKIDYSIVNSGVLSDLRVGFNVYAVGKHLWEFIEDMARKGRLSPEYSFLKDIQARKRYDKEMDESYAKEVLFQGRQYLNDQLLINFLSDEDFQDFVDKHRYWITGIRRSRRRWDMFEVYIKSKNGKEFRKLLNRVLYHPPVINIMMNNEIAKSGELYLNHAYEGRALVKRHIRPILIGLEFLWGKRVKLETTEYEEVQPTDWWEWYRRRLERKYRKVRVVYTCENKRVTRTVIHPPPAHVDYDD